MAASDSALPEPGKPKILDEWISRADLGQELGLSVDTLARWETRRFGPACIRVGRRVIYRRESVQEWLREQEKKRPKPVGRK
jgi:predicted DNA-binding transcriptional regulator AlpA